MQKSYIHKKDCPLCVDTPGFMKESDGKLYECHCILVQRAMDYLTPRYAHAPLIAELKTENIWGKYFVNLTSSVDFKSVPGVPPVKISPQEFKSIIKSYLINTGMKIKHNTVDAGDIIKSHFMAEKDKLSFYADIVEPDLLIIEFFTDSPNKLNFSIFHGLIKKRISERKYTWLYTHSIPGTKQFIASYSQEFSDYLEKDKEDEIQFLQPNIKSLFRNVVKKEEPEIVVEGMSRDKKDA